MRAQIGYILILAVVGVFCGVGARLWLKPASSDQIYVKHGCIDRSGSPTMSPSTGYLGLVQCRHAE